MAVTYAHSEQTILLPRVTNGSVARHFKGFHDDYAVDDSVSSSSNDTASFSNPVDDDQLSWMERKPSMVPVACDICPPTGKPALACKRHGYIYNPMQYQRDGEVRFHMEPQEYGYYLDTYACWSCLSLIPNVHCNACGEVFDKPLPDYDYYDYYDYYLEEDLYVTEDAARQEIDDFYDRHLRADASDQSEQWWHIVCRRHYDDKHERTYRKAISRSEQHQQRDKNAGVRGRFGGDNRKWETGATSHDKYVAMKEAEI